ncbi:MAG: glutathione S-transferase family protein [Sulfitobacter sp.]
MTYVLHYAPDNASLIIRLALAHRGLDFRTVLVDRASAAQSKPAYRALNPNGLIPVLETPQGPMFETGAILLWLADTHGGLGPAPADPRRGDFLKWLFFIANTIHPSLRMLFYPEKYILTDHTAALREGLQNHLHTSFCTLDDVAATRPDWFGADAPTVLDFYTVAVLRWPALYPSTVKQTWFDLTNYPALAQLCAHVETLPCCADLQSAEGLGDTPFTAPHYPTPPEGSAT